MQPTKPCLGLISNLVLSFEFYCSHLTRSNIRPQVWAVDLVMTDGHFNLPQRFVWFFKFELLKVQLKACLNKSTPVNILYTVP